MKPLRHFFMEEFRELYRSEKRWLIILPEVTRNMPPFEVEQAVVQHLEQTAARVIRLEEIFQFIIAADQSESRKIQPLLREAGHVLTAVTLSTAAIRKRSHIRLYNLRRGGCATASKYQN